MFTAEVREARPADFPSLLQTNCIGAEAAAASADPAAAALAVADPADLIADSAAEAATTSTHPSQ